jgi:hypothetical protein
MIGRGLVVELRAMKRRVVANDRRADELREGALELETVTRSQVSLTCAMLLLRLTMRPWESCGKVTRLRLQAMSTLEHDVGGARRWESDHRSGGSVSSVPLAFRIRAGLGNRRRRHT